MSKSVKSRDFSGKVESMPLYNVVVHQTNKYELITVKDILMTALSFNETKADTYGQLILKNPRTVLFTTHLEVAELKAELIQAFEGATLVVTIEKV